MIKFFWVILVGYFAIMIARLLFRMFIKKVSSNFSNPGQQPDNHNNTNQNQTGTQPKKKFYDPDKIEEAKFEELK